MSQTPSRIPKTTIFQFTNLFCDDNTLKKATMSLSLSSKKTVKFLLFMIITRMLLECPESWLFALNSSAAVVLLLSSPEWKQNGCCKHILMLRDGFVSNWHIAPLCPRFLASVPVGNNVFWREFSQACEYYLLARGISSENLLFQQLLLWLLLLLLKKPCSRVTNCQSQQFFYVLLRCLLYFCRQIIEVVEELSVVQNCNWLKLE